MNGITITIIQMVSFFTYTQSISKAQPKKQLPHVAKGTNISEPLVPHTGQLKTSMFTSFYSSHTNQTGDKLDLTN